MLHFGKISKNVGEFLARFRKKFSKILANFTKILKKSAKNSAIFNEKIEIRERCKGVHCVDLGESFPTSICLQNLASIQPRTNPKKFESSSSREFEFKLWNFEPLIWSPGGLRRRISQLHELGLLHFHGLSLGDKRFTFPKRSGSWFQIHESLINLSSVSNKFCKCLQSRLVSSNCWD